MPIFDFQCENCREVREHYLRNGDTPLCCGKPMRKLPSFPAMVMMKGEGGYPSRRKFVKGTAPYVSRNTKAWLDDDPYKVERSNDAE